MTINNELAALSIFAFTYAGLTFGKVPFLRLDRAGIALVGAVLCVITGLLGFDEAVKAIDFNTIILLFGMMIVAANLRLAGFFKLLSDQIGARFKSPSALLLAVILSSGMLSALYVNDTVCVFFTPFILEMTFAMGLNPLPFLIGLVTASNIGSAATIIGNPQNMLIGVFSGIPFGVFFSKMFLASVIGLAADFTVIRYIYRKDLTSAVIPATGAVPRTGYVHKQLLSKTLFVTAAMLVLFFTGFNLSLTALSGAAFLLLTRRIKPEKVYSLINWNLLMMFCGLFIVIHAFEKAGFVDRLFSFALTRGIDNKIIFSSVSALLSNLVSNVPAVILFKPLIPKFADPSKYWLLLSMSSTFAGNLTIIGSVANLIVVEQAKKHVKIGFWEYMKTGVPVTLITIAIGILLI